MWGNVLRGVAFGDAWGDPNEFDSITMLLKENHGLGPDLPAHLRITDDTQMTLYLAKALNDSWGKSPDEVRAAIRKEFLTYGADPENYRAPGTTVMGSLGRLRSGMHWMRATSKGSDGSGSVMRTSPCAFLPEDRWVGITAYAAAITHGTPNAIAAAILDVAMLKLAMTGKTKAGSLLKDARLACQEAEVLGLTDTGEWLEGFEVNLQEGFDELVRLIDIALAKLPKLQKDPWQDESADPSLVISDSKWRGGGWRAHETLVIAMLAIDMIPKDEWMALRRAVVTDGDSDTIGAVTGALLGALHPDEFMLAWKEWGSNFEKIYQEWIEDADHYQVAQVTA